MAILCTYFIRLNKAQFSLTKKSFYSPILLKHSLKKTACTKWVARTTCRSNRASCKGFFVKYISTFLVFLGIDLGSNTIQIPASLRGKSASTIGILFDEFQLFQSLQALPGNGSRASGPMAGSTTIISSDWKINLKMSVGWNTVNAIRKYVNRLESTFNIPNLFPLCTIENEFKMG